MDEYNEGLQDALNGEVRFNYSEYWSAEYRRGVIDGTAA